MTLAGFCCQLLTTPHFLAEGMQTLLAHSCRVSLFQPKACKHSGVPKMLSTRMKMQREAVI